MKLSGEYSYIIGIILLIISIIYPLFKIETIGKKAIVNYKLIGKYGIKESIEYREVNMAKEDVYNLKNKIMNEKSKLNEFVQKSYELNDKINSIFNDSLFDKSYADSMYAKYSDKLIVNEHNIDSINSVFNAQSNILINKISEYSKKTETHELQIINRNEQISLLILNLVLIFVFIVLMIVGISKSKIMIKQYSAF